MDIIQNDAHKSTHKLMEECSKSVFPLSTRDILILKKISINDKPPNLLEITEYVKKSEDRLNRFSISRRIYQKNFSVCFLYDNWYYSIFSLDISKI